MLYYRYPDNRFTNNWSIHKPRAEGDKPTTFFSFENKNEKAGMVPYLKIF